MASRDETQQKLLDAIANLDLKAQPRTALALAEAWAWLVVPAQPHGGGSTDKV